MVLGSKEKQYPAQLTSLPRLSIPAEPLLEAINPCCIVKISGQCFAVVCSSINPSWFPGWLEELVSLWGNHRKPEFVMVSSCTPIANGEEHLSWLCLSLSSTSFFTLGCWCLMLFFPHPMYQRQSSESWAYCSYAGSKQKLHFTRHPVPSCILKA